MVEQPRSGNDASLESCLWPTSQASSGRLGLEDALRRDKGSKPHRRHGPTIVTNEVVNLLSLLSGQRVELRDAGAGEGSSMLGSGMLGSSQLYERVTAACVGFHGGILGWWSRVMARIIINEDESRMS